MRDLIGIVESAQLPKYNLQAKYDEFNRLYFGNQLPRIPLAWENMKTMGGRVYFKYRPSADKRTLTLVPDSVNLKLSSMFYRQEEGYDAIMLHEMIHVYFLFQGDLRETHGVKFNAMRRKLIAATGIDIPVSEKVTDLQLNDKTAQTYGVVLVTNRDNSMNYAVTSASVLLRLLPEINAKWEKDINFLPVKKVEIFRITTPLWTNMAAKVRLFRTAKMGWYRMRDKAALEDLQLNGRRVAEITSSRYS